MQNLFSFIQNCTIGKEKLDKSFSIELYNFLRSYYLVEDFVKSMNFMQDSYSPYFAFYLPSEKQLFVNFDKMVDDINPYISSLNIPNNDKVLSLYLCLFHLINHEFKHICQEKEKADNPNKTESRLLALSDLAEQYYRRKGVLFSLYKIDPIERQAELSSLSQFISMAKLAKIDILVTKMTERYLKNACEGYCSISENDYHAKSFLNGHYLYDTRINYLINELNEYPILENNFDIRLELGLRITENEERGLNKL